MSQMCDLHQDYTRRETLNKCLIDIFIFIKINKYIFNKNSFKIGVNREILSLSPKFKLRFYLYQYKTYKLVPIDATMHSRESLHNFFDIAYFRLRSAHPAELRKYCNPQSRAFDLYRLSKIMN